MKPVTAADIGRIIDRDSYMQRVKEFRSIIRESGDPGAEIYLPGEIEELRSAKADTEGIVLAGDVVDALKDLLP